MQNTRQFRNFTAAMAISASLVLASAGTGHAGAAVTPPPPAGSSLFVQWSSGTVIGIATFLGLYDILRRTTCSGDFLNLGGPGFTQPIQPTDNTIPPPQCPPAPTGSGH